MSSISSTSYRAASGNRENPRESRSGSVPIEGLGFAPKETKKKEVAEESHTVRKRRRCLHARRAFRCHLKNMRRIDIVYVNGDEIVPPIPVSASPYSIHWGLS
jgi:hypothetical protein